MNSDLVLSWFYIFAMLFFGVMTINLAYLNDKNTITARRLWVFLGCVQIIAAGVKLVAIWDTLL